MALKWATPSGFDRAVDFGAYATWFIGRHSGPLANPDETYLKDLIFGVAPYDIVGVSTLTWWHTDPDKWQSIWTYVPTIRRVRRVTAANTSEGLFGSTIARDDVYGWGGKIQYMNWKLVGVQDMLVPIAPHSLMFKPRDIIPSIKWASLMRSTPPPTWQRWGNSVSVDIPDQYGAGGDDQEAVGYVSLWTSSVTKMAHKVIHQEAAVLPRHATIV